jgi:hypothetical protein
VDSNNIVTVIFKRLFDIDGVGFEKGSVPTDFITNILSRSWNIRYLELDSEMTYYSAMTSNSLSEMETWTLSEFKRRSKILKLAVEQKKTF